MEGPRRWADDPRPDRYRDLDHPADLWLEVRGDSLSDLVENALFALFDQLIEMEGLSAEQCVDLEAAGTSPAEAVRDLLAEALFLFDSEHFAVVAAEVTADVRFDPPTTDLRARLWGQTLPSTFERLKTEVKAVTHHRLRAEPDRDGRWTASLILDA